MPGALQHAQIRAPRTNRVAILVRHHARQLMHMSKIVNGPRRQKLRHRHHSQRRMFPAPAEIFAAQIQGLQRGQIFPSQPRELVKKLVQRLPLAISELRQAIKRIKWPPFAVLENDPQPRHPVRPLARNQVPYDVERAPRIFPLVVDTQQSGIPRNSASKVAGVRARTAVASFRLNSFKLAMPA